MYEKYRGLCPGGVHSSVRFDSEVGHPIYFSRANGSKIWDVDGNEFIDCVAGYGGVLLGHNDPAISEAVRRAIETGLTVGVDAELSFKVAQQLADIVPSAECVKFSVTGTEAIMHAIHILRGYTGKDIIMKVEGSYGGWYDSILVSNNPPPYARGPLTEPHSHLESAGILKDASEKTVIFPFNHADIFENLVRKYKDRLAGVILTPVIYSHGCILPEDGYLDRVKEITDANGVPLVFDEVISGFRCAPGGAQELYGVKPDLTVFGKAIANGYPLSGVVGKAEIMHITAPGSEVGWQGTHNANQISLAAASACLNQLKDGSVQRYVRARAEKITKTFNDATERAGLGHMVTCGGIFTPYFAKGKFKEHRGRASDRRKYLVFWSEMMNNDILIKSGHLECHYITRAHTDEDVTRIESAIRSGLNKVKESMDSV